MSETARTTIDQSEVDRFSAMAAEWWDPTGKFRPLHKFNPVRSPISATGSRSISAAMRRAGSRLRGCGS